MATRDQPPPRGIPNNREPQMGPPQLPEVPSEGELKRLSQDELIRRLRWCEGDRIRRMSEHNAMTKDFNKRMQGHILEIRSLRETNQQLQKDNQELKDLCCFLDDDRQKGRKLSKEWQKFGHYTASVMRTELDTYPTKLKELEEKQKQLIEENIELKEICYLLDQERGSGKRNSLCSNCNSALTLSPRAQGDGSYDNSGPSSPRELKNPQVDDHTKAYIQRLEDRIHSLEQEKRTWAKPQQAWSSSGQANKDSPVNVPNHVSSAGWSSQNAPPPTGRQFTSTPVENGPGESSTSSPTSSTGSKPEAVMHALKVLQVHDELDKSQQPEGTTTGQNENLNDNEKAIVREMCNVVWRKLGDAPPDAAPLPMPASSEPTTRTSAPPRHSTGSYSNQAPPRYGNIPEGGAPPRYMGSTNSLDRVPERKPIHQHVQL
ncbi:coiled-coil domain-containing protein 85C-like isoform X2 [Amphiura filiformis]|uniref:coiled-coil domain-containing protein 85C-like isoform X2 n=1 Tax=Amphiura filiformis TaxID=82378 RepID=UPI003B210B2C